MFAELAAAKEHAGAHCEAFTFLLLLSDACVCAG
jgi:hypothetical protein